MDEETTDDKEVVSKSISLRPNRVDSLDSEAMRYPRMENPWQELLSMPMVLSLAFQSIGIVYGDLGTSPLYVFSSTFTKGIQHKDDVVGALSLIMYTLTFFSLFKYVFIVLQANDDGEGGTFALYSLLCRHIRMSLIPNNEPVDQELSTYRLQQPCRQLDLAQTVKSRLENSLALKTTVLVLVLVGAACVIGDGCLTPSISVLSAVQGIKSATPKFDQNVVVSVTCVILIALFCLQRWGTSKVAVCFAPVVLIWFLCIGVIGLYNIIKHDPSILKAISPHYIILYFIRNKKKAWLSLGGIVLSITGTEAMYADLGHFCAKSIQVAFVSIVYPCLLLAYAGQGAYLNKYPAHVADTFYKSIPDVLYWPMFLIATAASIIASQAMISAVFSIVNQAMAMGCFPRLRIIHTSKKIHGQIYIPAINWLLLVLCLGITLGFQDTNKIGHAYGIAVVAVFLVTTILVTLVMILIWQSHVTNVISFLLVFGLMELLYFTSVLSKFPDGGYVPLAFTGFFLIVMVCWHYGRRVKYEYEAQHQVPMNCIQRLSNNSLGAVRVPGVGLVYSEFVHGIPVMFSHLLRNLPAVHSILCFVSIKYLHVSTVPANERFLIRTVGSRDLRMFRCAVRYGYNDTRNQQEDFEHQLIASLANFICCQALEANPPKPQPQLPPPTKESTEMMPTEGSVDGKAESEDEKFRMSSSSWRTSLDEAGEGPVVLTLVPGGFIRADDKLDHGLQAELEILYKAQEAGVVHLLGRTHVQADQSASFFKRLVINHVYSFLSRNSMESGAMLMIPHESMLQVGMTYNV